MAYQELIKNYELIRHYLREFYIYGYKSRLEYQAKSSRSYDDERRRIESWLYNYVRFSQNQDGKNVYLSIDTRIHDENPFYRTWKTCSFTDKSITLYFIIFDILYDPTILKTVKQLMEEIDQYLSLFDEPYQFDESTIRKKCNEYEKLGLLKKQKEGKHTYYYRNDTLFLKPLCDVLDYFSEVLPCGVIGSFIKDRMKQYPHYFSFKHHYMTQALDMDQISVLFDAMHKKYSVTFINQGRHQIQDKLLKVVPLKIMMSVQGGRQYLIAYHEQARKIYTYRLDYIHDVKRYQKAIHYDDYQELFHNAQKHMWGVNCHIHSKNLEHVEFDIYVGKDEPFILQRLEREKRCGSIQQIDEYHYRFIADVYDVYEMIPWIRTFIGRITRFHFSNRSVENTIKEEIEQLYQMYEIESE